MCEYIHIYIYGISIICIRPWCWICHSHSSPRCPKFKRFCQLVELMKKFLQLIIIDIISLSNSKIAQDFCPLTFIPPSGLLPASWETTRCKRTPSFYNKLPGISRNSGKLPSSETTHIPPNLSEDGIVLFLVRWDIKNWFLGGYIYSPYLKSVWIFLVTFQVLNITCHPLPSLSFPDHGNVGVGSSTSLATSTGILDTPELLSLAPFHSYQLVMYVTFLLIPRLLGFLFIGSTPPPRCNCGSHANITSSHTFTPAAAGRTAPSQPLAQPTPWQPAA